MPISDRSTSVPSPRARLLALAPATCLLFSLTLSAQQPSALAQAELQRRAASASEARELLEKGDEAYQAGRWGEAVEAYGGARELLPEAPATAELRDAATERLVQASVERAREQGRLGDVKGAGRTVDRVLDANVAPDHGVALEARANLDDPIRTNPAATPELAAEVEEVRLLLYKAAGFEQLGSFDKAHAVYEDVLRVDPTNKAARRGMESVARHRADYARAAYDETRSSMLAQVDGGWELRVRPSEVLPGDLIPGTATGGGRILLANKLERIVLPVVDFDQVSIREALDFLRAQSIELDALELDPAQRGVNFVLELGDPDSAVGQQVLAARISLQLKNVPLVEVLRYIGEITRTTHSPQEYAVAVRPAGSDSSDLITRTYRVAPDFLSSGGSAAGGDSGASDPFAETDAAEGLIPQRLSAQEVLKQQGISFPEGSNASFNAATSTLRVINTAANHAMVEQIVEAGSNSEPAMVLVEVRMVKTQERVLKELGFDWLLGEFSLGGTGLTPGASALTLTGGVQNAANMSDIALPAGEFYRRSITNGNRSGSEAIVGDSIDDLILEQQMGFSRGSARAPGILWANGVINNTNLTMLMRGLDRKKGVDMVVSPATATRSGQQSTIEILREFIYPTEYEPPELPNNVSTPEIVDLTTGEVTSGQAPLIPITPATPTSFETRGVGVVLDVLPTVSADRHYVDIALKPSVTDFDGFINYGTPITTEAPSTFGALAGPLGGSNRVVLTSNEILMPVFSVMRTETNLTVADGATLVIGGMMQEKLQKVEDSTPILGDLPVVGRMFQSSAYAPVRTAVVFFVTVRVVDPTGKPFRDH
jgi:general secretion pathway protein D